MGMYFRVGPGDPRLPACVMSAVAGHALHPAAGVAEAHSLRTVIEINNDFGFTITMDQQRAWGSSGCPAAGYFDSLLDPEWLWLAAAAALPSMWKSRGGPQGVGSVSGSPKFDWVLTPGLGCQVIVLR